MYCYTEEGTVLNSFHEVTITPISKTNNTAGNETCRQIVLINTGTKSFTKHY